MILEDFHVHSTFSDGAHSPGEVAERALEMGMRRLGFSDHGYAPYDTDCCIPLDRLPAYMAAVRSLRSEYAGRMEIFCGVERDYFSTQDTSVFDYVIGAVHYLPLGGEYLAVDWKPEHLRRLAEAHGGDMYAVCEDYFALVADVVRRTGCQLIAHFDLISKLNTRYALFDEEHPRYVAAWRRAADALLPLGVPFEINTGALSRGYRSVPYPAPPILRYLAAHGAAFVLSSDSHHRDTLLHDFARQERLAREMGAAVGRFMPAELA